MSKIIKICEANLTSRLLPETGRSQSNEPWNTKPTKPIEIHQSRITNHDLLNSCNFLRGPLRWLTKQKNPKYTKRTARYNEFRYKSRVDVLLFVLPTQLEQRSNGSQVNIQSNVGEGKLMMTNADAYMLYGAQKERLLTFPYLIVDFNRFSATSSNFS